MFLITKKSENYCAIPTGNLIAEVIENTGMDENEFVKQTGLSDDDFYNLREGNTFLTSTLAETIGNVLHISSEWLLAFDAKYRRDLLNVERENALSERVPEYA